MRPGFYSYRQKERQEVENVNQLPASPLKKAASFPYRVINVATDHIDDFDFDKDDAPETPSNDMLVRNEMWSPGFSPVRCSQSHRGGPGVDVPPDVPSLPDYGTTTDAATEHDLDTQRFGPGGRNGNTSIVHRKEVSGERKPLLEGVPGEVTTGRRGSNFTSLTSIRTIDDVHSLAESVFSDIRSESTATKNSISHEAQDYWESSVLQRAFPERLFALAVTLLFEIPVLLMVSGGSDRLCYLIGRTKYQLLMGFLPLSSAISGNVGLQAR
jgi:hypothetical protein